MTSNVSSETIHEVIVRPRNVVSQTFAGKFIDREITNEEVLHYNRAKRIGQKHKKARAQNLWHVMRKDGLENLVYYNIRKQRDKDQGEDRE